MEQRDKASRLIRKDGVLASVRGCFDALPTSSMIAGGVATLIAMFLVALLVEVSFGESTWRAHRWAFSVGLSGGVIVGCAVRMLGGTGPRAGGYAIVLSLAAAAFGIVLGTMWKTHSVGVVHAIFDPLPLRPFATLFGAAIGALFLVPEVSPIGRRRDSRG